MSPKALRGLVSVSSVALAAAALITTLSLARGSSAASAAQLSPDLRRITTSSAGRNSLDPVLSPDDKKIVFVSDADFKAQGIAAGQSELWLYDMTTLTVTRLTTASHAGRTATSPSRLSADGRSFAFASDSDFRGQGILSGQREIWLYDLAALTATRLTTASDGSRKSASPSISADGTRIAFAGDSDFLGQSIPLSQTEIWLYDAAALTVTRVTTASSSDRRSEGPRLTPDGSRVFFSSDSDFLGAGIPAGQYEVWMVDVATMGLTRLTTATQPDRTGVNIDMRFDGTQIVFRSDADFLGQGNVVTGQHEIWLYDMTTLTLTRLTTASDSTRSSSRPTFSGDGSNVFFQSSSDFLSQGNIVSRQIEIWLYDTAWLTLTRITTASDPGRDSTSPAPNADGSKVVFFSTSDFLDQGLPPTQREVWLYSLVYKLYLPVVLKNS